MMRKLRIAIAALALLAAGPIQAQARELPFAIIRKESGEVVGTTRFYEIDQNDRRVAIGYTWLAVSAQRTCEGFNSAGNSRRSAI